MTPPGVATRDRLDIRADLRLELDGRPALRVRGDGSRVDVQVVHPWRVLRGLPRSPASRRRLLRPWRPRIVGVVESLVDRGLTVRVTVRGRPVVVAGPSVDSRAGRLVVGTAHLGPVRPRREVASTVGTAST